MKSALIVCEGNICRSPMAQALLAAGSPETRVRSAGLGALIGAPPHEISARLMQERGIDITTHRASQLNRAVCLDSDLVLVMDTAQRSRVELLYPEAHGRVFRLGEFTSQDIPDPYHHPEAEFRRALLLIEESVEAWLRRISNLKGRRP